MKLPFRSNSLTCAGWALVVLCAMPQQAMAQDGWTCSDGVCIETEAQVARSVQGSFAAGVNVSPERQIDRFAALEQQRWTELRFEVLEPTLIEPTFVPESAATPPNWPQGLAIPDPNVSILVSRDAETYSPLEQGAVVTPGSYVSVLIGQGTVVGEDGMVHFYPADWSLTLASRRIVPQAQVASRVAAVPALVPSSAGQALGCDTLGCGTSEAPEVQAVDVVGAPDPESGLSLSPSSSPRPVNAPATARLVENDLAREMQIELARVGCYTGEIDGLWGPNSRGSVAAFNSATGQSLQAQDPTPSALVAVARQPDVVCAAD